MRPQEIGLAVRCGARRLRACMLVAAAVSVTALAKEEVPVGEKLQSGGGRIRLFPRRGNHFFRIPGLAVTRSGVILAFAGERKGSILDFGRDTDVVLRRSLDGGATWTGAETILSEAGVDFHSGPAVADRDTGAVFKFARSHGAKTPPGTDWRENYVLRSDDDGLTWSKRVLDLRHPRASSRFGPGNGNHGIQLADGRLVIQGGYIRLTDGGRGRSLCLIESIDHGETWRVAEGSDLDDAHGEFCIAETAPQRIALNVREVRGAERRCGFFDFSAPAPIRLVPASGLPGARCHAGMVQARQGDGPVRLYYTGPVGLTGKEDYDEAARVGLSLFRADSAGDAWTRVGRVYEGKSGYSDLALLPDGGLGCLFESGEARSDEEVFFIRIPLPDLGF